MPELLLNFFFSLAGLYKPHIWYFPLPSSSLLLLMFCMLCRYPSGVVINCLILYFFNLYYCLMFFIAENVIFNNQLILMLTNHCKFCEQILHKYIVYVLFHFIVVCVRHLDCCRFAYWKIYNLAVSIFKVYGNKKKKLLLLQKRPTFC